MLRQDKGYVATSKLSARMPIVLPMQKQKHNWNWAVKYFILCTRLIKISQFRMTLKRLKSHQFLMVWHERYPAHKHRCRNGGRNLEISAKKAVFLVSSGKKTNFTNFVSPLEKCLEKSISAPLWKKCFWRPKIFLTPKNM